MFLQVPGALLHRRITAAAAMALPRNIANRPETPGLQAQDFDGGRRSSGTLPAARESSAAHRATRPPAAQVVLTRGAPGAEHQRTAMTGMREGIFSTGELARGGRSPWHSMSHRASHCADATSWISPTW